METVVYSSTFPFHLSQQVLWYNLGVLWWIHTRGSFTQALPAWIPGVFPVHHDVPAMASRRKGSLFLWERSKLDLCLRSPPLRPRALKTHKYIHILYIYVYIYIYKTSESIYSILHSHQSGNLLFFSSLKNMCKVQVIVSNRNATCKETSRKLRDTLTCTCFACCNSCLSARANTPPKNAQTHNLMYLVYLQQIDYNIINM